MSFCIPFFTIVIDIFVIFELIKLIFFPNFIHPHCIIPNTQCFLYDQNYHVAEGDIRVIRPLCLIRERQTREYSSIAQLPVIFENCPACFEAPKERQRIKVLLASQEHIHPNLFSSLLRSMKPLMRRENSAYTGPDRDEDDDDDV